MANSTYGFFDRVLHRLALHQRSIAELTFSLDQALTRGNVESIVPQRHIFVSGLARAGTTALMRRFYATGHFRSLTYRDMPFVLAPGLWRRLSSFSTRELRKSERAHGDGLLVDADSPEGLEEVFWRVFAGEEYLGSRQLRAHEPRKDTIDKYIRYIHALLSTDAPRKRYLCKNNNNILRLNAIRRAFPNAIILIPFRDPVQHALSLQRQHERFSFFQREDSFLLSYMTWLGHHEFGRDHRPFLPTEAPATYGTESLNYWVALWCEAYEWLHRTRPDSALFICYEDLCTDEDYWTRLRALTDIPVGENVDEPFRLRKRPINERVTPGLLERASAIYARLATQSRSLLSDSPSATSEAPKHSAQESGHRNRRDEASVSGFTQRAHLG